MTKMLEPVGKVEVSLALRNIVDCDEAALIPVVDIRKHGLKEGDTLITTTQAEAYANESVREVLEQVSWGVERLDWVYDSDVHILKNVQDVIKSLIPKE